LHNLSLGMVRSLGASIVLALGLTAALTAVSALPAAAQDNAAIDVAAALSERSLGSADAPVTIVEYASMTCPHCADFHADTFPALKERYIDTGKVRLVFNNFVLNGLDMRASMMARCVPEDRFFSLTDVLFKTQNVWGRAADPLGELAKIGRLAGLDETRFTACMAAEPLLNGLIAMRQKGSDAGVASTPTLIVNGERVVGGHTIDELAAIIDPLLPK
jgi:protein-disulfide isomerase